jgi:hypothetical protein
MASTKHADEATWEDVQDYSIYVRERVERGKAEAAAGKTRRTGRDWISDGTVARGIAWTDSAWQELESAAAFIARDSPRYGTTPQRSSPKPSPPAVPRKSPPEGGSFRRSRTKAFEEIIVKSYRLIYEINDHGVVILAFIPRRPAVAPVSTY